MRDDRALFELLILEGAQAGLAWITILRKRDGYRRAFDGFDPSPGGRPTVRPMSIACWPMSGSCATVPRWLRPSGTRVPGCEWPIQM